MQAMCHRFDQGQTVFTFADCALEQWRKALARHFRLIDMFLQPLQGTVVILDQLMKAQRQARERQFVSAENKVVLSRDC